MPLDGFLDVWYSSQEKSAAVAFGDWTSSEDTAELKTAIAEVVSVVDLAAASDWVKIATQPPGVLYQKRAYSTTLRAAGSLGGYFPDYFGAVPGVPSPLAAMLASGTLGAGLGYGTGWVLENALPEKWKRKRLRHTLSVIGALGGAAPAAIWGGFSVAKHGLPGLLKGWPLNTPPATKFAPLDKQSADQENPFADRSFGDTGAFPAPIDVASLVQTIYAPPVSRQLSPVMQAATVGLVVGAGHRQTGGTHMPRLVSPLAVGSMAAGMGSGWLSGLLVGKVLGALTGMPASAQKRLRDAGLWAGAISNLVPLAFPNR